MSIRRDKVATLIQRELAVIFQRDSRALFGGAFITVMGVRISPDLSVARVYLSFLPTSGDTKEDLLEMVRSRTSAVRGALGRQVGKQLRVVPELHFYVDDSLDYAEEIDDLLKD